MRKLHAALAVGGFVSLAAGAAQAQDAPAPPVSMPWLNGFYVRGDVGGAIGDATKFHDTNPKAAIPILMPSTAESETGVSALVGGGVGYRFNSIFRGDLTLDYMPGFRANFAATGGTVSGLIFGSGNLDSTVGMANAYVQLDGLLPGSFGRFQPYVDGGVGFARNHLETLSINATPTNSLAGATKTNFAWGLGMGFAYPLSSNVSLDFGYRFLNLGPMETGTSAVGIGTHFVASAALSDDVTVHTFTAGLRWNFGPVNALAANAPNGTAPDLFRWIPNGTYIRGDLGAAFGNKITFSDTEPNNPITCLLCGSSLNARNGNSVIFGAGIGYRINPMFRADATVDDMPSFHASASSGSGFAAGTTTSADIHSLVGLANGYFDLNGLFPNFLGPFQPFVVGSVGVARNEISTTTGSFAGVATFSVSGAARTNFAWGAGAGVGYALTPQLTAEIAYKYLDLGPVQTGTDLQAGIGFPINTIRSNDLTAHTVTAGLRWSFGAPAAPPPSTATPAPASPPPVAVVPAKQMFIVFFEFDKSALTVDGKKLVDAAPAAFKSGKPGVAIAGYTDLAGSQQYNLALSKRRADTVKAALVKDGVPAAAIDESWHGKENPRVPTADGVREPQNRRVEIAM